MGRRVESEGEEEKKGVICKRKPLMSARRMVLERVLR